METEFPFEWAIRNREHAPAFRLEARFPLGGTELADLLAFVE
jgi:hypothetical protein